MLAQVTPGYLGKLVPATACATLCMASTARALSRELGLAPGSSAHNALNRYGDNGDS